MVNVSMPLWEANPLWAVANLCYSLQKHAIGSFEQLAGAGHWHWCRLPFVSNALLSLTTSYNGHTNDAFLTPYLTLLCFECMPLQVVLRSADFQVTHGDLRSTQTTGFTEKWKAFKEAVQRPEIACFPVLATTTAAATQVGNRNVQ